ncbi:hypothetical protein HY988_03500 [Candidatus Micrarchaeota archaeon]|nr:hypothetical protein [Candidatus Micrarchaeota archaeon]
MAIPQIKPGAQAAKKQGGPAQAQQPPQVDGFKIKGKRSGDLKDVANTLRSISFLEIAPEKDRVNVVYIESKDINKNPYLFSVIKISDDEIEVVYSIPQEIGPKKRRIDVIRYLLNILSLIDPYFHVENKTLYQLIENAVKEISEAVSVDYNSLYTNYDSLRKEVEDHKKKIERLDDQNKALTTRNYELKAQNDELHLKIGKLEGLSDESLKAKIQEWVLEHSGTINVPEFAKVFKTTEARVEETLNRLVSEGYLEAGQ